MTISKQIIKEIIDTEINSTITKVKIHQSGSAADKLSEQRFSNLEARLLNKAI